jgi:hypothetical protein
MIKLHYEAIEAVQRGFYRMFKDVAIDWDDSDSDTYEALVSWCCLGSTDLNKAKEFKKELETAMEIAEILNRYEIKSYYADSIEEDDYRDIVNKIQKVGDCMFETIFEWIIKKYGVEE